MGTASEKRKEAGARARCPPAPDERHVGAEHGEGNPEAESRRSAAKGHHGSFARGDREPPQLHVVEELEDGGDCDDPANAYEAIFPSGEGPQQPLAAAEGGSQRNQARPQHQGDQLFATDPLGSEDLLRCWQILERQRRSAHADGTAFHRCVFGIAW